MFWPVWRVLLVWGYRFHVVPAGIHIIDKAIDNCLNRRLQDVLARFSGTWTLIPVRGPGGAITGCKGVLEQDVLPIGKIDSGGL